MFRWTVGGYHTLVLSYPVGEPGEFLMKNHCNSKAKNFVFSILLDWNFYHWHVRVMF